MEAKKMGGARPGAGRPKTGRIRKTIWVTPNEFIKLKTFLEKLRKK